MRKIEVNGTRVIDNRLFAHVIVYMKYWIVREHTALIFYSW